MSPECIKVAIVGHGQIGMRAQLVELLSNREDIKLVMQNLELSEDEVIERAESFLAEERERDEHRKIVVQSLAMVDRLMWEPAHEFSTRPMKDVPFWACHGNKRSVYKCNR